MRLKSNALFLIALYVTDALERNGLKLKFDNANEGFVQKATVFRAVIILPSTRIQSSHAVVHRNVQESVHDNRQENDKNFYQFTVIIEIQK